MLKKRAILHNVTGICLLSLFSCTSVNISPDTNLNDQIKAENRVMRQNLTLAVRENSVLKEENFQYKNETSRLKSQVKLLVSEIESLNKKHVQDIALLNEKYDNLNKKKMILEKESLLRINELTDANKTMEVKMSGEITKLNENIRKQEEAFNKERAEIETAFSSKELEFQKQLAELKKDKLTAGIELESLKSKLAESEANLESVKSALMKEEKTNRELKDRINSLSASDENKKEDSAEKQKGTR